MYLNIINSGGQCLVLSRLYGLGPHVPHLLDKLYKLGGVVGSAVVGPAQVLHLGHHASVLWKKKGYEIVVIKCTRDKGIEPLAFLPVEMSENCNNFLSEENSTIS